MFEVWYFEKKAPVIPIRLRNDSFQEPSPDTIGIGYPANQPFDPQNIGSLGVVIGRFNT